MFGKAIRVNETKDYAANMKRSPLLLVIFLVVFVDLLGFGLVIPILPYYATQYGANAFTLGWLMGAYSLAQFVFAPVWGRLSDIYGRRPVILLTLLGTALAHALVGFAPSLLWLFVGRTLAGLFGGNISTATAYIADVTTEENRAKGMGIIGAGFGLGFMFGPALGGILSVRGYGAPALAAAGLSLINICLAAVLLQEPPVSAEQRAQNRHKRFDSAAIGRALSTASTRNVIVLFFVVTVAFTQLEASFALFMQARFGFDAREAGWLLGYMGVIMVVLQGGLVGRLSKRFGEKALSVWGTFFMGASLVLMGLVPGLTPALIAMTFIAIGNGMNNPALMSLVSRGANANEKGAVMGVYQSAGALARIVGPPAAGYLFDSISIAAPLLASAALMLISCVVAQLFLAQPVES